MKKYIVTISGASIQDVVFDSDSRDSKRHLDSYIADECIVRSKSGKVVSAARINEEKGKAENIYYED
ncbi:MAG: hypothetical protein J6C96_00055 [Oscillospiraceae bacterium]|nr:hypothetical protein [Oscillospiraceae bacterium]